MADILTDTMLVYSDPMNNNNKFYHVIATSNSVIITYGRVGAKGTRKESRSSNPEGEADRLIRAKKRKGYAESKITSDNSKSINTDTASNSEIRTAVMSAAVGSGIKSKKDAQQIEDIISRLVEANIHNIVNVSGGKLSVSNDGIVRSALGVVTLAAVEEAEALLMELLKLNVKSTEYNQKLGKYLTLIPQKVPSRDWAESFLDGREEVDAQKKLLTSIGDSLRFAMSTPVATSDGQKSARKVEEVDFADKLTLLKDKSEFKRIEELYKKTSNLHHRDASHLRLKNVYVIENTDEANAAWEKKRKAVGNVQELWHGTGPINILSILKTGLFVPKTSGSGIPIAGRMYGDFLYFSDQSTKSLRYSIGAWTGRKYEGSTFMFLADVVMGSEFRPYQHPNVAHKQIPHAARTMKNRRGKPYNSIKATGGRDGVINNEMMIGELDQISLKYLCEFK